MPKRKTQKKVPPLRWKRYAGSEIQAPLICAGDYVISCRPQQYTVSYRPPGQHHHVGTFVDENAAKLEACIHHRRLHNAAR